MFPLRAALVAADETIRRFERRLDERIGAARRKMLARYCSVLVIGIPIAVVFSGFVWNGIATAGLVTGIALFAVLDTVRAITRRPRDAGDR